MVKTKPIVKKASPRKRPMFDGMDEGDVPPKNNPRPRGDWWDDVMSGETCRTGDIEKVRIAIDRSNKEGRGINIQGFQEHSNYFWYITHILTEKEIKKQPVEERNDNAMRLHNEAKKRKAANPTEQMLPHGTKTAAALKKKGKRK